MSFPILVTAHSGYKANERPKSFLVDEDRYEIAAIEVRRLEPNAEYFRVRSKDDKRNLLRYDRRADDWTLQSGIDGDALLARPDIEIVTVDAAKVREAESKIEGCEHCHPNDVDISFDWILQEVTGRSGMVDFVMTETAKCPNCRQDVTEKTLVEPK